MTLTATERQRERRRRLRLGRIRIAIEVGEHDLAEALAEAGMLTLESTLDREKVEGAVSRIVRDWVAQILSRRDFGRTDGSGRFGHAQHMDQAHASR